MKYLAIVFSIVVISLSGVVGAAPVCVTLSGDTTKVLGYSPCDPTSSPPGVQIDTGDARYTTFIALSSLQATVDGLLATGVAMTFANTTTASDHYAATAAAIQALLNAYTKDGSVKGNATITVQSNTKGAQALPKQAYADLLDAVVAYNTGVLAAKATALANGTAPVFPPATASSVH